MSHGLCSVAQVWVATRHVFISSSSFLSDTNRHKRLFDTKVCVKPDLGYHHLCVSDLIEYTVCFIDVNLSRVFESYICVQWKFTTSFVYTMSRRLHKTAPLVFVKDAVLNLHVLTEGT